MINAKPAGLLSLLGLKSGLDSPRVLSELLNLTIDVLPFYIANVINFDESTPGFAGPVTNFQLYPVLTATPEGKIRYVQRASASLSFLTASLGNTASVSGWFISRPTGALAPISAITYGLVETIDTRLVPYSRLKNLILQPGERLGMFVSAGVGTTAQVNFSIRYADFIL